MITEYVYATDGTLQNVVNVVGVEAVLGLVLGALTSIVFLIFIKD